MRERPGSIVRAPNHLGDVVLALPALVAAGSDVMIVRPLVPLLDMAGLTGAVLPLDRGPAGFARGVRELRRRGYRSGVLLSAAFSAAWLFRWGGVRHLRGTRTDGRGWLLKERVEPEALRGRHRADAFRLLMGQEPVTSTASHRLVPPADRIERWRRRFEAQRAGAGPARPAGASQPVGSRPGPLVAIFPGANAPARRWPAERFAEVARRLAAAGRRVVVLGGPAERALTAAVAAAEPLALDLGGRTDLVDLAAILSLCDLVVTNDTGPMHLAGAVGTPTVSLWGSSDPAEVAQTGSADTRVSGAELPCAPCRRNHCHRRGRGTVLDDAHVECMRLIDVQDVVGAAEATLERRRADEAP